MANRSSLPIGRVVAWPLIVGGGVLSVAWAAWEMARGHSAPDAISTAASALAAFAVGVVAVAMLIDLIASAMEKFTGKHPRFLGLDWMVPAAVVLGFGLGWLAWQ